MIRQALYTSLFFMILIMVSGCRAKPANKETIAEPKEAGWHMTDEIVQQRVGPAEEEAFRQAAYDGDLEKVKMLMSQGLACNSTDPEGHTALMFAAFNGHSEIVLALLEAGTEIDQRDHMGRTALLYGATGPFPETVKVLLDRGADPNAVDADEHFSPLMHAAAEGNLEVVKVLLSYGADRALEDVDGDNAASFAAQNGHMQVEEYLKMTK